VTTRERYIAEAEFHGGGRTENSGLLIELAFLRRIFKGYGFRRRKEVRNLCAELALSKSEDLAKLL